MARKPVSTTDRAPAISPAKAKNSLPSDIHRDAVNDIYDEAKQWLEPNYKIGTEAEAEGITKLRDMARQARDEADESRKVEKKPFDDGAKEVQDRYKPITTKAQNIIDASNRVLTPWNNAKIEAERRAAQEAREEAERKMAAATRAAQAAGGDLGAIEVAQNALDDAKRLTKTANRIDRTAGKGTGMRTIWTATLIEEQRMAALKHYLAQNPQAFVDLLQELADADVRAGVRSIPGFNITSHQENK